MDLCLCHFNLFVFPIISKYIFISFWLVLFSNGKNCIKLSHPWCLCTMLNTMLAFSSLSFLGYYKPISFFLGLIIFKDRIILRLWLFFLHISLKVSLGFAFFFLCTLKFFQCWFSVPNFWDIESQGIFLLCPSIWMTIMKK